jgi:hypothetical protein
VNSFAASTPSMNVARFGATATLLPSGKVLIAGGNTTGPFRGAFTPLNSTELYDPVTNSFAASTPSMNAARVSATATLLPNGKVLIAGGLDITTEQVLTSTELYDPVTNSFAASTPSMNVARYGEVASLLPNGKVLIAGGLISFDASVSIELYDPVSDSFAASTPTMNMSHFSGATATLLPNGKVLIAGGDCCGDAPGDIDLYDPVTNSFTASTPSMNAARASATATLLPNGKVLIAGGSANPKAVLNSTEIYTP